MGMLTGFALAAAAVILASAGVAATPSDPPTGEGRCMFVSEIGGKPTASAWTDGLHVLDGPEALPITVTSGGKLDAIVCERKSAVPDLRDDRVLRQFSGVTFNISTDRNIGELALGPNGFSYTLLDGDKWTPDEQAKIIARLTVFNQRLRQK